VYRLSYRSGTPSWSSEQALWQLTIFNNAYAYEELVQHCIRTLKSTQRREDDRNLLRGEIQHWDLALNAPSRSGAREVRQPAIITAWAGQKRLTDVIQSLSLKYRGDAPSGYPIYLVYRPQTPPDLVNTTPTPSPTKKTVAKIEEATPPQPLSKGRRFKKGTTIKQERVIKQEKKQDGVERAVKEEKGPQRSKRQLSDASRLIDAPAGRTRNRRTEIDEEIDTNTLLKLVDQDPASDGGAGSGGED
jgi:hypothetical protein